MTQDERSRLFYLQWNDKLKTEKPYQLVSEDLPELLGISRQNFDILAEEEEIIRNVREKESSFTLDDNGFMFLKHDFGSIDLEKQDQVEQLYKPKLEKILRETVPGADELCFFQWRLRANRRKSKAEGVGNLGDQEGVFVPAHFVHLDQTLYTAIKYVEEHRPDWTKHLSQGRLRILNIWKPYSHVVQDCPLALCDGSTVRDEDLIVCDNITKYRIGELVMPTYNPNAKWYYLERQRPDELTIMKIVDSDHTAKAKCCPHTAFDLSQIDPDSPPRRSLEMRALVLTYP